MPIEERSIPENETYPREAPDALLPLGDFLASVSGGCSVTRLEVLEKEMDKSQFNTHKTFSI